MDDLLFTPAYPPGVEHTIRQCLKCNRYLLVGFHSSEDGWYVGEFCPECGPVSRCSSYAESRDEIEKTAKIYRKMLHTEKRQRG